MDKWIQSKTAIQLISLFLAVILWFVVNYNQRPVTEIAPPSTTRVEITPKVFYDEERYKLTKRPDNVIVNIQGKSSLLNTLWLSKTYEVYVDLTPYKEGTHNVPVLVRGFPRNVTVDVIPNEVSVTLEAIQRKEITVEPQLIGKPADGFKAGEPTINPNGVLVIAPDGELAKVGSVKAFINIEGVDKPFKGNVALKVFDKNGKEMDVDVNPAVVEVNVPITSPFIKVPLKIDFINELPEGISIASVTQNFNEVTVYGPKDVVGNMEYYLGPRIDLSTMKEDRTYDLRIPLREGLTMTDPEFIEVKVDVEASDELILSDIPIKIINTIEANKVEWVEPPEDMLEITIIGAPSILKDLASEDIQASIDVSRLPAGNHTVSVQLSMPNYVRVKGENPSVKIKVVDSTVGTQGTEGEGNPSPIEGNGPSPEPQESTMN